jgi:hypothetical protein
MGIAGANDTDLSANYLIRAGDSNGAEIGRRDLTLAPRSARAFFLDELFGVLPNNIGPVLISSNSGPAMSSAFGSPVSCLRPFPGRISRCPPV